MINFQEMISRLIKFWSEQGCVVHQGYDLEVGAGTFNPATFLRCLGPEPYSAVYVEPSRRPKDGRYGENPNRTQFYYQMQVILKPSPENLQELYLRSLEAIGLNTKEHDIRFVHDDWENPTIGAWGLGWEVWADGMEVTQFTYFQAVGGMDVKPVSGELTYGLERLALYLQGVESFFEIMWNDEITYGQIYKRNELEWSHYNFEEADVAMWLRHFDDFELEAKKLIKKELPIPAYDFVIKASHSFNILDARGVISVTERTGYINRIRALSKMLAESYIQSREKQNYPLLKNKRGEKPSVSIKPSNICNPLEKQDFLLEIGSEELPASFVGIGLHGLQNIMQNFLNDHNISFESTHVYGTPRRLAIVIKSLSGGSEKKIVEKKGPLLSAAFEADGTPTKVGSGFFRSLGLEVCSLSEIEKKEISGVEIRSIKNQNYLFVNLTIEGHSTRDLLSQNLASLILKIDFPKKMRWGDLDIEYARPLRWVVALYGSEVVPFIIADIVSDRLSYGHRQLDPAGFSITSACGYLENLSKHWVMASIEERKNSIDQQLSEIESKLSGVVLEKNRVMSEVINLVEWPFVTTATFDEKFLKAPKEVLISEMVTHQRYFPLGKDDQTLDLLPYFAIVCNNKPTPLIKSGNQKALSPRLADGVFLYEEDLKSSLDTFSLQLKKITFHNQLGSMWDKVRRIHSLCEKLHDKLSIGDKSSLLRAADLSKADLASHLVGEFPELQGVIGSIYASVQKEKREVSSAIREHWMPLFEKAPLPKSACGIILSIADKVDNLLSCFMLGLCPTSSSDPYALRRQTIGIIKTLIENKLHLSLNYIFSQAVELIKHDLSKKVSINENVLVDLEKFILSRFRNILIDYDYRKDDVEAVLACGVDDCYEIFCKISSLNEFREKNSKEFLQIMEMYTRIKKILFSKKSSLKPLWEICKSGVARSAENHFAVLNKSLFQDPCEDLLYENVQIVKDKLSLNYREVFHAFASLNGPVDVFFNTVKVVEDDILVRENRLSLLQEIWDICESVLCFDKLQI